MLRFWNYEFWGGSSINLLKSAIKKYLICVVGGYIDEILFSSSTNMVIFFNG